MRQFISEEHKRKIGNAHRGKVLSMETRRKMSLARFGKKASAETKEKMGKTRKKLLAGDKHWNWKGGITSKEKIIRHSIEYKIWVNAIFSRDGFTCQKTKKRGGILRAHHILNFSTNPELRFAIDNGITLSEKSHRDFHKRYGVKNNTYEQLQEFLNTND